MNYLYLIRSGEYHKIGIANDVSARMAQLQTGNPEKLKLVSCWQFDDSGVVEKALHQKYTDFRVNGEWFILDDGLIDEFHSICSLLGGKFVNREESITQEDIEDAEEITESLNENGVWAELVKVNKWYSMRLMKWDAEKKKKVYVRYLGTLEKCKQDPVYSGEAHRLESTLDGKDIASY